MKRGDPASRRVAPPVSELTEPYWEAARHGRLDLQRCTSCRRFVHFPEYRCPWCGSIELGYETVSGRGQVHTFTVVWRTGAPGYTERVPYALAWVDLIEQDGLRAFGNVHGTEPAALAIGMPVEVCFEEIEGFGSVPTFRAA
jgi:uncharacterized protein